MSSRPQFSPRQVIVNGNMTLTLTSEVSIIQKLSLITYTYSWAGSAPSGTVIVQISNDYTQNGAGQVLNPGTWNTLPLSTTTTVSGNTGTGAIDIELPGAYAIRTMYTPVSGTGSLQAFINGKVS